MPDRRVTSFNDILPSRAYSIAATTGSDLFLTTMVIREAYSCTQWCQCMYTGSQRMHPTMRICLPTAGRAVKLSTAGR